MILFSYFVFVCVQVFADEFSRVVGSMISARGEVPCLTCLLFPYVKPGFLSLDLYALEKMLEKVDVHERLYIHADLLPPEMFNKIPVERSTAQGESSGLEADSLDQVKDIPILREKSSATEADLDFLLNSFSEEPNPLASASNQKPCVQRSSAFETELDSLLNSHGGSEPPKPSHQKLNTTGFGDVLDDLLESTSLSTKPQGNQTSSSSTVGKSKVLDEFDSWLDTI
uniref:Uncharacterized protein n=1 Tax=Brassica oleracea var. oleracea TaxID=109376 RepID=A0A0D3D8U8_BRAOL